MKEQLHITLRKNRRLADTIQIAKKSDTNKICQSYNENNHLAAIKSSFTQEEQFEMEWLDQMIKYFLKHTNSHATDLERYRLFLPAKLYRAMYVLWLKCQENNIDYRPMDSMIKSIINKMKATETKLYEKTGEQLNSLAQIDYSEPETILNKEEQEAKIIFSQLMQLPQFFEQFNQLAKQKYRKSPTIKLIHFKGYAKAHHLPPKWVYACAIDVIGQQLNPLTLIDETSLWILWVMPNYRIGIPKTVLMEKLQQWEASSAMIEKLNQLADEE